MHDDQTVVSELVARALEYRDETGTEIDLDQLCGERPDLQTQVETALEAAARLPGLQAAEFGGLPTLGESLSGRYRIDDRLGAGAMGVVYSATDVELGRKVAIKVLHHGLMERGQALARFEREAEALAAVRQENVVTIHDRGFTRAGAPFLIMELVEGMPLSTVLEEWQKRPVDDDSSSWLVDELGFESVSDESFLRQSVRWASELSDGLAAVHGAKIVHRDVKPSNILIRWDGRPVMVDFGAVLTAEQSDLTRTGAAVGTPAYMAPESLDEQESPSDVSDVYGLAATLYHLITRRAPYVGAPQQVLTALATRDPIPAVRLRPGVPKDLQAILDVGMARSPKDRFEDAQAFGADLRSFLSYRPVKARRISTAQRLARRLRRSRAFQGGAAVAAVLLGALAWSNWVEISETRRRERFAAEIVHLPCNFGVVSSANRVLEDDEVDGDVGELFDRMVETGGEPVVARALRASYWVDRGDHARAIGDMRSIADTVGSDYTEALASRYAALPPDSAGVKALNLEGMPDHTSRWDHYLAGFHALRTSRLAEAWPLLKHDGLARVRHAQELLLMEEVIPLARLEGETRFQAAGAFYESVLRVESQFGARSSTTANFAGYALAAQERNDEALPIYREGLALAPAGFSASINAARAAYRVGAQEESEQWMNHTIGLLPSYSKPYETGTLLLMAKQEFDAAREWVEAIPYPEGASGNRARANWMLQIATDEALEAFKDGEMAEAKRVAEGTLDLAKYFAKSKVGQLRTYASLCEALVEGDLSRVFHVVCDRQIADPLWAVHLETLVALIPAEPTEADRAKLREVLDSIANALKRRKGDGPR